jgi:hypothetical protein
MYRIDMADPNNELASHMQRKKDKKQNKRSKKNSHAGENQQGEFEVAMLLEIEDVLVPIYTANNRVMEIPEGANDNAIFQQCQLHLRCVDFNAAQELIPLCASEHSTFIRLMETLGIDLSGDFRVEPFEDLRVCDEWLSVVQIAQSDVSVLTSPLLLELDCNGVGFPEKILCSARFFDATTGYFDWPLFGDVY